MSNPTLNMLDIPATIEQFKTLDNSSLAPVIKHFYLFSAGLISTAQDLLLNLECGQHPRGSDAIVLADNSFYRDRGDRLRFCFRNFRQTTQTYMAMVTNSGGKLVLAPKDLWAIDLNDFDLEHYGDQLFDCMCRLLNEGEKLDRLMTEIIYDLESVNTAATGSVFALNTNIRELPHAETREPAENQ